MIDIRDLQFRVEYAALLAIVALVRAFPLDTGQRVSAFFWRLIAPRTRRHRRAMENLALALPEKSEAERERIALAMWANLGRVMAEGMQLDRILADPSRLTMLNPELTQRYFGKSGNAIGVTMHTGNWELAVWPLLNWGGHPAGVYRLVKNPYVDRYVRSQRKMLFPAGMLAKGRDQDGDNATGQKTARQIMDFVRQGGRLGLVCDLFDAKGIPVEYFGHAAKSTPVPAMIARRVGARIWAARCIRIGVQSRFAFEVKELKVPRTDNAGDDIRAMTAAIHQQFETWVREHPEQWMWSNRRWK